DRKESPDDLANACEDTGNAGLATVEWMRMPKVKARSSPALHSTESPGCIRKQFISGCFWLGAWNLDCGNRAIRQSLPYRVGKGCLAGCLIALTAGYINIIQKLLRLARLLLRIRFALLFEHVGQCFMIAACRMVHLHLPIPIFKQNPQALEQ